MHEIIGTNSNAFQEVYFGGNWTSVNMEETLADVNWQEATTQVHSFNTIASLVYHINYSLNPFYAKHEKNILPFSR